MIANHSLAGAGPTVRPRRRTVLLALGALAIAALALFAALHAVDNTLTPTDRDAIARFVDGVTSLPPEPTYVDELAYIRAVQRRVLTLAPRNTPLPFGHAREPADVLAAGQGLCFDRSRVLEKIYRAAGFETRHVALYSTVATGSALTSLVTPGVSSHAVTEVRTLAGWLVVDSNAPWVSADRHGQPLDMRAIQAYAGAGAEVAWRERPPTSIYVEPFTFLYGLYSRHGRFYPPYNFWPDVHYGELLHNVL